MSTNNTYRDISHFERLRNPAYRVKEYPVLEEHYNFVTEEVLDKSTNRIVKKLTKKLDNPNPFGHLKVSDFTLENLQSSGSINHILPCSLSHDVHTTISTLEKSVHNIVNSSKTE